MQFFFVTSKFVLSINLLFLIITVIFLILKIYKNLKFQQVKEGFIYNKHESFFYYKKKNYHYFFFIFYSIFIPIFLNIDLIFAKIFFDEYLVSNYIIIANLAKIVFFLPNILLMYIFNEVNLKYKKKFYKFNFKNLTLFFLLNLLILFFLLFFIEYIIIYLYGEKFLLLKNCFFVLLASFLLLSFSQLITNFLISLNNKRFIILYILSFIIYLILTYFNNDSPILLAYNLLFSTAFLFLNLFFYFRINFNISKLHN
jgi:O-antigen/teichoic acid export membrane protein